MTTNEAEASEPTPEKLRKWAGWFDSPDNRAIIVENLPRTVNPTHYTVGYLLRRIADAMEETG